MIKVYIEQDSCSELVALMANDEVYNESVESLEKFAAQTDCQLTDSDVSDTVYLGFSSFPSGHEFNQILMDGDAVRDFVYAATEGLPNEEGFDFDRVDHLELNESYRYEFSNESWIVITATTLF